MPVKACYSTPLLHVAEIERSLKFYALLGFETVDTDGCQPIGWARMHGEGGAVIFLRAERPVDGSTQSFLLYMYTPNLLELCEQLRASGIPVPPIGYPGYMPSGEIALTDPDGYTVLVAHWGKQQQENWEKRTGRKP
jgi:catechol 2,3-dioxygenase-like lactoylglutathione lyase family enzyme